jgi:hypothetical protein
MIPRATKGRGFKGAAAYYLHDKGAQTAERVKFTQTRNLISDDPHRAINEMCWTFSRQDELKELAGIGKGGRKLQDPVYAFSLSWHEEDRPTDQQMIEAADAALKFQKMEDYQAVIVAHSDTAHPHIHVIVNRVHPETGVAHKLSCDHNRFSDWARKYQQEHGQHWCPQREINHAARQQARADKAQERRKSAFIKDAPSQKRDSKEGYARRAIEARAKEAAAAKARAAQEYAEKQERAKAEKFEQWATDQLNALQARQIEQRGIVAQHYQAQRTRVEARIEKQYGKDRREESARLAQLREKQLRGSRLARLISRLRGEDAERKALEKNLANIDMRSREMLGKADSEELAAMAFLAEQQAQERQKLELEIERGRQDGYTIPTPEPARERPRSRERDRGMERGFAVQQQGK